MPETSTPKIDKTILVEAAYRLLDEVGLDGLSMRALGRRMGVNASAFYWHIRDRAELIEVMAAKVYEDAATAVPQDADWPEWLRQFGRRFRAEMLKHRDTAQLCASVKATESSTQQATRRLIAPLEARGLNNRIAATFFASVVSLALGWAIYDQNGHLHRSVSSMIDFDSAFEGSLEAMIAGFSLRLSQV